MSDRLTIFEKRQIQRRVKPVYNEEKKERIKVQRTILLQQIKLNSIDKKSNIHDNQDNCAMIICAHFHDKKIISIMVLALPQSGKTGTILATVKRYVELDDIPIENIYIITGLSSTEWKIQTQQRMPDSLKKRIYHRNDWQKFVEDIKGKQNCLIFIDEIQLAAKDYQTMSKAWEDCGFYDKDFLLKNDIKFVEFSATPDGTVFDHLDWGKHGKKIDMQPGDNYTSLFDLKEMGKLKQFEDLSCYNKKTKKTDTKTAIKNIMKIKKDIDSFDDFNYNIIRINKGDMEVEKQHFKTVFGENCEYIDYTQNNKKLNKSFDINDKLKTKPTKDTFIFIKEKCRCAKTIYKKYIGVFYERISNKPDDAVIVQSLAGRLCGYDYNGYSICYTNIESITRYEKLWESKFLDRSVKWNSKTTKYDGRKKKILSTGTYKSTGLITGMTNPLETSEIKEIVEEYKTHDEVQARFDNYLKKHLHVQRGPNKRKPNSNGFYEATIFKERKVWSYKEIKEDKKYIGSANNVFRYYPCYKNINDKTSIVFLVIYNN